MAMKLRRYDLVKLAERHFVKDGQLLPLGQGRLLPGWRSPGVVATMEVPLSAMARVPVVAPEAQSEMSMIRAAKPVVVAVPAATPEAQSEMSMIREAKPVMVLVAVPAATPEAQSEMSMIREAKPVMVPPALAVPVMALEEPSMMSKSHAVNQASSRKHRVY